MDRRERWGDQQEAIRLAMLGLQARMWTALPGIVVSFDPEACTAVIQPAVGGVTQGQDNRLAAAELPLLVDVPVVFPRGGGCMLTFPVQAGDEALVVFASRPIDGWWQSGGVQRPATARMHDLSDGFAFVGPMSRPSVPSGISTTAAELRTDDGSTVIRVQAGAVSIQAANITLQGNVAITGGTLTHDGTNIGGTHRHGGVSPGSSNTSTPS